jgi:hypothetical protein
VPSPSPSSRSRGQPPLRWNRWNLLLLVPLLVLVTPLFNSDEPRLFGFPFFYWLQFLFIPLGVLCVAVVYYKTADSRTGDRR